MPGSTIPVVALLAIAAARLTPAQAGPPSFDQYRTAGAKFSGKPATPVLKTAEQRKFRTMIRTVAATGPDFAGHFTVAEWGCGAGCVSVAIVDAATGAVYPGPFRFLGWALRKYEGQYPSNGDKFEEVTYRLDSRLLVARGCPDEGECASYFWEWTGSQFKLVRKIPSVPIPQ
jgi:hypothetical protein